MRLVSQALTTVPTLGFLTIRNKSLLLRLLLSCQNELLGTVWFHHFCQYSKLLDATTQSSHYSAMAGPLIVLGQGELPHQNIVVLVILVLWKDKLDRLDYKVLPPDGCLASFAWLFWVRVTAHTFLSHLPRLLLTEGSPVDEVCLDFVRLAFVVKRVFLGFSWRGLSRRCSPKVRSGFKPLILVLGCRSCLSGRVLEERLA